MLFEGYGPIETLRLVRSSKLPAGRSFAFIKFAAIDDAIAAIHGLNGHAVEGGAAMEVKFADAGAVSRGAAFGPLCVTCRCIASRLHQTHCD